MRRKKALGVVAVFLVLAFLSTASASVSLLTDAYFLGGEKVHPLNERVLDQIVRSVAAKAGETCFLTEHHRFSGGFSYLNQAQVQEALEDEGWTVEEVAPFSSSKGVGVWYAVRDKGWKREEVLILLFEVSEGGRRGYLSLCQIR